MARNRTGPWEGQGTLIGGRKGHGPVRRHLERTITAARRAGGLVEVDVATVGLLRWQADGLDASRALGTYDPDLSREYRQGLILAGLTPTARKAAEEAEVAGLVGLFADLEGQDVPGV